MGTLMVVHRIFDTTTGDMEGSCLGTGITLLQSNGLIPMLPFKNGTIGLAVLILMILFLKNSFNGTRGHIRYPTPAAPRQLPIPVANPPHQENVF